MTKVWVLGPPKRYGLWVIAKVWVFDRFSVGTVVVDPKKYGLWLSMGYERYGL